MTTTEEMAAKPEAAQKTPPDQTPLTTGFQAPGEHEAASKAAVNYQVAVYTGDVPGAGTDGDVWIWFYGTKGNTGRWLYLDNSDNNFERNQTDYFYLTLPDLGTPVDAWIYFSPAGIFPDWFLSTVTINGKTFSHYNWISNRGMVHLIAT